MFHFISKFNNKQTTRDDKRMPLLDDTTNDDEKVIGSAIPHLGDTEFPFKGEIHKLGSQEYVLSHRKNYAYNTKYQDEMYPDYFVYPENDCYESIISAISFGKSKGIHVMGRSGGHQYCGVSSDSGSIIVDMQNWNTIGAIYESEAIVGPDLALKYPKVVEVGVGVQLGDLAAQLSKARCTVPMGECPSVCVGGHMQTGGWGHLARSNGLFTEHIWGFTIVTAEGIKKVSCESTGRELDLYNAVRGGSPGAFGIVTNATILLLCDDLFPNARSYGQIVPILDDSDNESLSVLLEMFIDMMNRLGNSSEALGVNINFTQIVRATPQTTLSNLFGTLVPCMSQNIQIMLVEATVVDDTDPASMSIFQEVMDKTEEVKRRTSSCCLNALMNGVLRIVSGKTLKDGTRRMPLSTINESFVRETPFVTAKTTTSPQNRVNHLPAQAQSLYPKGDAYIPTSLFVEGNKHGMTKGAKRGCLDIHNSTAALVGHGKPLDEIASQSYIFGSKRVVGPFPSTVQWGTKIRGNFGFDLYGSREGLADPRVWKNIQAFYDLEREYMLESKNETALCLSSFTSDSNGDTSQGGCIKSRPSLDLKDKRVQERYYDLDSEHGFSWVAKVKHIWDSDDIFHSCFTVPPLLLADEQAVHCS